MYEHVLEKWKNAVYNIPDWRGSRMKNVPIQITVTDL